MFGFLKTWQLSSNLKKDGQEAYSAVIELGRMGTPEAVSLLIGALKRKDGVARSAARELGRLREPQALKPLADLLAEPEVNQSAAEALLNFGPQALDVLITALDSSSVPARLVATAALGDLRDVKAVPALIQRMEVDDDYGVRTAAAKSLGELRDQRGIWVLVQTLKLRDETDPARQYLLETLRQAASLALRKIGDPLAAGNGQSSSDLEKVVSKMEKEITGSDVHPRLLGDITLLSEPDLVSVLKELIGASEEISWAKLESREPLLPRWFQSYEQRRQTAEKIGRELRRRGGEALVNKVLETDLNGYAAIRNWWNTLDDSEKE